MPKESRFLVVKPSSGYSKTPIFGVFSRTVSSGKVINKGTTITVSQVKPNFFGHWTTGYTDNNEIVTVPSSCLVPLDMEDSLSRPGSSSELVEKYQQFFPETATYYGSFKQSCMPQHVGGAFSKLTYSWLTPMFVLVYFRDLCDSDIWSIGPQYTVNSLVPRFQKVASKLFQTKQIVKKHQEPCSEKFANLGSILHRMFYMDIAFSVVTSVLHSVACYFSVILIDQILQTAAAGKFLFAHLAAVIMLFFIFTESVLYNTMYERLNDIGINIRTLLSYLMFVKMLKLGRINQKTFSVGQQFNILSGDLVRFPEILKYAYNIWLAPLDVTFYLCYLYYKVGLPAIYGFSILLLFVPINMMIGKKIKKFQEKLMISKDKRLKAIQEALSGIKVLKLCGWIATVFGEIEVLRDIEMKKLKAVRMLEALISMIMKTCPIIICAVVFTTYLAAGNVLTADVAFVIILVFNNIFFPIARFPELINGLIKLNVSLTRVQEFLNLPEIEISSDLDEKDSEFSLVVRNLKFTWSSDQVLFRDVNFDVMKGECVGIFGPVSSGKSSLLLTILENEKLNEGVVKVTKTVSYVPQQSWIMNGTVRDNILFGLEFDEERYFLVVSICCLESDMESFAAKDLTIVGNKGMNLSGGQKQRINIARALYARSKLILMDDPLCAVDATVGWMIFQNLALSDNPILKDRSILMVTHNQKYLRFMTRVYKLEDGTLTEFHCTEESKTDVESQITLVTNAKVKTEDMNVGCEDSSVSEEEVAERRVSLRSYWEYIKLLRLRWFVFISLFMIMAGSCNLAGRLLVAKFTSKDTNQMSNRKFLLLYGGCSILQSFFILISAFMMAHATYISSKRLHRMLTSNIFHSPMLFFEKNTSGYIMNFFSRDINVNDENIPINVSNIMDFFFNLFFYLIGIPIIVPFIAIFIFPLVCMYVIVQHVYVKAINQVQYLECVSRNPLYAHFMESADGVTTISAFKNQEYVTRKFVNYLQLNVRFEYLIMYMSRWLALRIEVSSALVIYVATAVSLHLCSTGQMSIGVLGFVVTFSLASVVYMNWLIRFGGELESQMVSFQRVHRNCDLPPEESDNLKLSYKEIEDNFVKEGRVLFNNFCTKYRPEQQLTLKNLNIDIKPGEKVAIVGRTGAGKSSVIMSLFRIISPVSGSIYIDGVDINNIPINTLRNNLTIIPQELFFFTGSIRKNIDPTGSHSDEEIWKAIDLCGLHDLVSSYLEKLDACISFEKLSAGEQQMFSLTRALVHRAKIVILDEATANMDNETEERIKNIIMTEFKDSTIITIAHRLLSILDYDRILVLQNGVLIESDSPGSLMKDPSSVFYNMLMNLR